MIVFGVVGFLGNVVVIVVLVGLCFWYDDVDVLVDVVVLVVEEVFGCVMVVVVGGEVVDVVEVVSVCFDG